MLPAPQFLLFPDSILLYRVVSIFREISKVH